MKSQEWKIVKEKTDNPIKNPPRVLVVHNDVPVAFVQSYSVGRNNQDQWDTLLLEIAVPQMEFESVDKDGFDEYLGNKPEQRSKYINNDTAVNIAMSEEEAKLVEELGKVLDESEKSDAGSSTVQGVSPASD